MQTYHVDSPEALWRLITIMGLSDGCFRVEDELPEALWATEFIDGVFGRELSTEERERLIEQTTKELNSINNHTQLQDYLRKAAGEIRNSDKQDLAISILFNILIADGIIAAEEVQVFITLCEEWEIDVAEATDKKIPSMQDIQAGLITAGVTS
jgi:hypothetical protein